MSEVVDNTLAQRRFQMRLAAAFGGAALLLALVGIYGVLAHSVAQRRMELGLRLTLGATRGGLLVMLLRRGLRPVLLGFCAGLILCFAMSQFVRSLLFGIAAIDPLTIGAVSLILLVTASLACLLPARVALKPIPPRCCGMSSLRLTVLFSLLVTSFCFAADPAAEIRATIQHYVDVRDHPDPQALEGLFSPDADQLVSSGEWRKGRDAVVKGTIAASQREAGKRTITIESVRFLSKTVAIADGRYELLDATGNVTRKMWTSIVLTRDRSRWHIAAIRNMLPASAR